jgi:hypothetical protein
MPTKIDLADIPIIDHHAHALNKTNPPQTLAQYQVYFSESGDSLVKQRDVSGGAPRLVSAGGECFAVCGDGELLRLLNVVTPRGPLDLTALAAVLAQRPLMLA